MWLIKAVVLVTFVTYGTLYFRGGESKIEMGLNIFAPFSFIVVLPFLGVTKLDLVQT